MEDKNNSNENYKIKIDDENNIESFEEAYDTTINNSLPDPDESNNDLHKNGKENKPSKSLGRDILEMLLYFTFVIVFVVLVHQFVGQQIEVNGSSMENTLHSRDHLILEKISYETGDPERFDIIVFKPYSDQNKTFYIKRVIGLPGDSVHIIGSDIYINNELLEEKYGKDPIEDGGIANEPIVLGEDEYFLMGDNRNNSTDSRDPRVGIVNRSQILGRAWVRIWPLRDFGVLEHQ
ncbi:MAG: signal peptidase [Anaerocolumna sp.]|jgi:signal peptidase I|nr:signal peptidase [Anaerocolumna sp.]